MPVPAEWNCPADRIRARQAAAVLITAILKKHFRFLLQNSYKGVVS